MTWLLIVAAFLGGCGGGSSPSSGDPGKPSSAEPSEEFNDFEGVRGIEPVATFGKESNESEREEASAVLTESLTARQEADFATQCATLGKRGMEAVFHGEEGKTDQKECAAALEELAKPLSKSEGARGNTLTEEIAALRVKGDEAFALYHGNDGNDYAMPMEKEDGEWKVGSLITLELPKTPPKPPKKKAESQKGT